MKIREIIKEEWWDGLEDNAAVLSGLEDNQGDESAAQQVSAEIKSIRDNR